MNFKFNPEDTVVCKRHYEKEIVYSKDYNRDHRTCPAYGKKYVVREILVDYKGRIWIGLEGVGKGFAGWLAENFEKYEEPKTKNSKRLIRL